MNQTPQAKKLWEAIPPDVRVKLLNNVWCSNCAKSTGVGKASMTVESSDLIIRGVCTACGSEVARLVEGDHNLKPKKSAKVKSSPICHNPDISNLAQFRDGTNSANLIKKIGKLRINSCGQWSPKDEFQDYGEFEQSHPYDEIIAFGSRSCWEMENILPGYDPDDIDCPIGEGIDLMRSGDWDGAVKHMKGLLSMDSRCLDAYAHLGNWYFELAGPKNLNTAMNFYKTGVAVGLKSIGNKINDVFPWGLIDNRPFFRCLHGFGLCYYRKGKTTEALRIFSKMIWLNPSDNQGARFLVNALVGGVSWVDFLSKEADQVRH